jgi:hypothetical protein
MPTELMTRFQELLRDPSPIEEDMGAAVPREPFDHLLRIARGHHSCGERFFSACEADPSDHDLGAIARFVLFFARLYLQSGLTALADDEFLVLLKGEPAFHDAPYSDFEHYLAEILKRTRSSFLVEDILALHGGLPALELHAEIIALWTAALRLLGEGLATGDVYDWHCLLANSRVRPAAHSAVAKVSLERLLLLMADAQRAAQLEQDEVTQLVRKLCWAYDAVQLHALQVSLTRFVRLGQDPLVRSLLDTAASQP